MERKLSEYLENIFEGTQSLELFHCIDRTGEDGFKYALSFTDDFSGPVFVYFLTYKSDSLIAFKPFLADCSQLPKSSDWDATMVANSPTKNIFLSWEI